MTLLYKLLILFCYLSVTISLPVISTGLAFGATIYRPTTIGTPIYYERPYDYYYHDNNYYYDGPNIYPYEYSPNYEYVGGGGFDGFYGSISYAPYPHIFG